MSEYGPSGASSPGQAPPPLPSEEIRYDLNGNPLPSPNRPAAPTPAPSNPYAAPPPAYGAPSPPPTYAPPPPQQSYAPPPQPPSQSYAPPQQPYGQPGPSPYGAPPGQGYAPGQNPPQAYGPQGGPYYGAPQPAAKDPGSKVGWYVAIGVAVCIVLFMVILGNATKPPHVDAPAVYRPADSPDKAFTCDGPDGWTMIGAGTEGSDEGGLLFTKGLVKIDITDSGTLSYMSDGMKAPASPMGDDPNMPPPPPPVEKMHEMLNNSLKEKYDNYVEQPMQPLQAPFGDSRVSEWTAKGGIFTGNIHGYRVTMLGLNKVITVDCHCPESNWDTMKPVFLKVVQSISVGNG